MSIVVKVPCDYKELDSYVCSEFRKGRVLFFGEIGYRLPEEIVCPKCLGTGEIDKPIEQINNEIKSLKEDIEFINDEIRVLEGYLK